MQDIGGRFFGVAGAGDRRLRPHHNHQAALKCPRCDSANTKFCYYNNYNLSQPRHFCKSCRRYWTRGGVLRNVPVGGGCRKTKRSSKTKPPSSSSLPPPHRHRASSNSSSDPETSSLTNNAAAAVTPTGAVSAPPPPSATSSAAVEGSKICHVISGGGEEAAVLFSDMGTFTNLMTSPNDVPFGFGNVNDVPFRETSKLEDQTTSSDQVGCWSVFGTKGNGEFGSLDWHPGGGGGDDDQGLFDLPNTVDHAYWSQAGQWSDQDPAHSLYLP